MKLSDAVIPLYAYPWLGFTLPSLIIRATKRGRASAALLGTASAKTRLLQSC